MYRASCVFAAVVALASGAARGEVIAHYRGEFQGPAPAAGWTYLWNSGGAVGDSANYAGLVWEAGNSRYETQANGAFPDAAPGSYLNLSNTYGHPGQGTANGSAADRFAVARYTIQTGESGHILIAVAVGKHPTAGANIDVQVYVNDALAVDRQNVRHAGFTADLGTLAAGAKVDVAIGPDSNDGSDSFDLDILLARLDERVVVADYQADTTASRKVNDEAAQTSNPSGRWRYKWNSGGIIGNPANYADMAWAGGQYDPNGTGAYPDADPAAYVQAQAGGSHPGRGSGDAGSGGIDRYAIAGWVVPAAGAYDLVGAAARQTGGGTVDFEVYVNGSLKQGLDGITTRAFHTDLGTLAAGDVVYVALGPNGAAGYDTTYFDFTITTPAGFLVGDYRDDFQGGVPGYGWQYLWNSAGAIGASANYASLVWDNNTRYETVANSAFPDPNPGAYAQLSAASGHPGHGTANGSTVDRFTIARYTLQPGEEGRIWLAAAVGKSQSAGANIDVQVYVNDVLAVDRQNSRQAAFTANLGTLAAGAKIDVAVGPDGEAGSDAFDLDVTLAREAGRIIAADYSSEFAGLTKALDQPVQASHPGTLWRFLWNSAGAIGNAANYADLLWSGGQYDGNGTGAHPATDPVAWTIFQSPMWHPGRGSADGGSGGINRYAIAACVVQWDGFYDILGAVARRRDATIDIEVYVNNSLIVGYDGTVVETFHKRLGKLKLGDVVYVAVGPNGADGNDGTHADFTLLRVPGQGTLFVIR